MADLTIQPTSKFLKAGTIFAALIFIGLEILYFVQFPDKPRWLTAIPPLVLLWPLKRWIQRSMMKTTITGDRLRCETGLASKSTRTIQLSKVQDVRVDQRMTQRMFNVGNISIETAGEASRLTLVNIDAPQTLADEILNRAHSATAGV